MVDFISFLHKCVSFKFKKNPTKQTSNAYSEKDLDSGV